jgi:hypothetical protein
VPSSQGQAGGVWREAIGFELSSRRTDSRVNGLSQGCPIVADVASGGEVGEVLIEGARVEEAGCHGAEDAQAGRTGGIGSAVE